jgi:hypothetical protein
MTGLTEKLKLIYKPFLVIAISIIAGYTLLNWLFIIKLHILSLNEEMVNFWIPFALPWIPLIMLLRPRIKLLNLKRKKGGDLPSFYVFIAGFAIVIPTIIAQSYLQTATGKLTKLYSISQIDKQEATKYYNLKNFYLEPVHNLLITLS